MQDHTTGTLCACSFAKVPRVWRTGIRLLSLFLPLFFLEQANLHDTLRVYMHMCAYSSYQPRGWKGVGCKKIERRSLPISLEEIFRATSLESARRIEPWPLFKASTMTISNFANIVFGHFIAFYIRKMRIFLNNQNFALAKFNGHHKSLIKTWKQLSHELQRSVIIILIFMICAR